MMRFAVRNLLVLVVVTSTAGTGDAFVPPTRTEYGQCGVEQTTPRSHLHAGGASCRVRWARLESSLFAKRGRPKIPDEELKERKEQLHELLCVTKKEIDKFVRKNPDLLLRSDIVQAYSPKLILLQERLGISQKAAGRMCLNNGRLLNLKSDTLNVKLDWLQARLNLSKTQLRKIMKRAPGTLASSIEDHIEPSLKSIQFVIEMSDKELTKMLERAPDLLKYNYSTEKLAARLSFLQNLLSIEKNDIATLRKALAKSSHILFWPEEKMVEVQHWISERLGLSDARIAQMSRNRPEILVSKVTTLEEKVDWVQTEMSLSDEELGELFGKFPSLFGYCPKKNLEPKLRFLRLTFDLNDDALREMLLRMPSLFAYSEKTVKKKLKFYAKLIGEEAARELVVERPYLIGNYSVENLLEPRLEEVRKSGGKVKWDETTISRLATRTDAQWEKYGLGDAKSNY